MTNAHFTSVADYRDIESLNWASEARNRGVSEDRILASLATKSRDNARTPMQWDDGPQAGFTTGTPWLAINPNHREVNAAAAVADPESVLHHYRALIAARHTHDVVVHGDHRLLLAEHEQVFAYVRTLGRTRLLVLANLSGAPASAELGPDADMLAGEILVATHQSGIPAGPAVLLQPWESLAVLSTIKA